MTLQCERCDYQPVEKDTLCQSCTHMLERFIPHEIYHSGHMQVLCRLLRRASSAGSEETPSVVIGPAPGACETVPPPYSLLQYLQESSNLVKSTVPMLV